jgi:hypothetical protein
MNKAVRVLMWAHYIYLLSLPTLAVVASRMLFPESDFWQQMIIIGFAPVLMYALFLANGYAIPNSLPIALIITLAIPLQIALSVFLFGSGSVWLFFGENAAVEVGAFAYGTLSTAFINKHKETDPKFFVFLLLFVVPLFFGGMIPYFLLVYYGYGGFSLWLILFITSFATAFREHSKVYKKAMDAHKKTGEMQEVAMKYDGGFISRILGIKDDVPLISPLRNQKDKGGMNKPILILGFTSMFLPLIVSMILEIVKN